MLLEIIQFPGFRNTILPSSSDGIRLTIDTSSMVPDPDQRGIDVSAGYSTLVAIAGKEVIRKPWPYGTCTSSDHEFKLLRESIRKLLRPTKTLLFCVTLPNHGKNPPPKTAWVSRNSCICWVPGSCSQTHKMLIVYSLKG